MGASQSSIGFSHTSSSRDRPLPLVSLDAETGRILADQDTLSKLRQFKKPVLVVGAVGPCGSGKSSLLTSIMQTLSPGARGLPSCPNPDPCTQGLWISSLAATPMGASYAMLFLDTQGLFSPGQQRRDMCSVLTLAILLSSVLIYNEPGRISSCSQELLTLCGTAAGLVRAHPRVARHRNKEVTALSKWSPTLFWVLRDASLGEGVSPGGHLARATAHSDSEEHQPEPYSNALRRIFCQLFPDRRCFALVRPVAEEQQLNSLNEVSPSRYRAPFARGLQELGAALQEAGQPRVFGKVMLSGPLVAALCEACVAAINEGAIHPYLWQNAMQYVMQEQAVGEEVRFAQLQTTLRDIEIPGDIAGVEFMASVATGVTVVSVEVLIRTGILKAAVRGLCTAFCAVGNWVKSPGVLFKRRDALARHQLNRRRP